MFTGPTRGELEMLKNQANEISNTSPVPGDLGMGIMRMPGKVRTINSFYCGLLIFVPLYSSES